MQSLHPALAPLEFLVGVWRGVGKGRYPTIEPFEYFEEATYVPGPGKPFIAYSQRTRRVEGEGEPLHSETGYIRPAGHRKAELVVAQPTGIVEVHVGVLEKNRIEFRTSLVGLSTTAVNVSQVKRAIEVREHTMTYRLDMAAVDQPMQIHLEAQLTRDNDR